MPGKLGRNLRTMLGDRVTGVTLNLGENLRGKPLPDKYLNEQYQEDDQRHVLPDAEVFGPSRSEKSFGRTFARTKYFDQTEQDESTVRTDEQGRLIDHRGNLIHKKSGYIVSKDDGTMHLFEEGRKEGHQSAQGPEYDLRQHHSSPIQGRDAAAAGELVTEDGVIRKVTDKSGHYQPTAKMTHQLIDRLQQQGVAMREQKLVKDAGNAGHARDAGYQDEVLWQQVNNDEAELERLSKEVARYEAVRSEAEANRQSKEAEIRRLSKEVEKADDPHLGKKQRRLEKLLKEQPKAQDLGLGMSNREAPYDPEMLKKKQRQEQLLKKRLEAQDLGLGMSSRAAEVEVFHAQLSTREWDNAKGNRESLKQLVKDKIGNQNNEETINGWFDGQEIGKLDKAHINEFMGTLNRQGRIDTNKSRIKMTAEQFVQTGGNKDTIVEKRKVTDRIKDIQSLIASGDADVALSDLGVQSPGTLSVKEKVKILGKSRGLGDWIQKRQAEEAARKAAADKQAAEEAARKAAADKQAAEEAAKRQAEEAAKQAPVGTNTRDAIEKPATVSAGDLWKNRLVQLDAELESHRKELSELVQQQKTGVSSPGRDKLISLLTDLIEEKSERKFLGPTAKKSDQVILKCEQEIAKLRG
jgi:hypothetical protein